MSDELVVTDADREAAAEFFPEGLWKQEARDDVAQAFARHRTKAISAIQASLPDEVKAMVEKLEASLHVTAGRTVYVNPAGRAAAAMLTRLSARIADLEAQIARDKAEWVEIPRMTMGKQTDG